MPRAQPLDVSIPLVEWMRMQREATQWVYHPRRPNLSDFVRRRFLGDLLAHSPEFARDSRSGDVACDLNVSVTSERTHRRRKLDLVIGPPLDRLGAAEDPSEPLRKAKLASILLSLEVKFCMTEHRKATSRLIDELCSSAEVVKRASPHAICTAIVIVNLADRFTSPLNLPGPNLHERPYEIDRLIARLLSRVPVGSDGYDVLSLGFVDTDNETRFELGMPRQAIPIEHKYGPSLEVIAKRYRLRRRESGSKLR